MTKRSVSQARAFIGATLGCDRARAAAAVSGESPDWSSVLTEAGPALHPMLAHRCATLDIPVPAEAAALLALAHRRSAVVLARRRAAVREALASLKGSGIEPIVLKGFALAHLAYPAPELRPMVDLDLWVGGDGLRDAVSTLAPLGWTLPWRAGVLDGRIVSGSVALQLGSPPLLIELHAAPKSLLAVMPAEVPEIRKRAVCRSLGGMDARVPCPEDMIVHVAVHAAANHRFVDCVLRLLDIALLVERQGTSLDWDALARRARTNGAAGLVATALEASRQLFSAPVPAPALAAFAVHDVEALGALACEQAWLSSRAAVGPRSIMAAAGPAARARAAFARLAEVVTGPDRTPASPRSMVDAWTRLRLAVGTYAPTALRAVWSGAARGESARELGRFRLNGDALVAGMARAGEAARVPRT